MIPTRVRRPRDKAKVENAVLQVERWILAPLRNHRFFSIAEANRAVREQLDALNDKPLTKLDVSRRQLFEEIDRPALQPLPAKRFEIAERKLNATVGVDYHAEYQGHYYSVPFQLLGKKVDIRATSTTVEIFHKGRRVASHLRSSQRGRHTTEPAHQPKSHHDYGAWPPSRFVSWAKTVGPETVAVVQALLDGRIRPEFGYRACFGIFRLGKQYGAQRLERASRRALELRSPSYKTLASMLKAGLEDAPLPRPSPTVSVKHENVRGPDYYN